MERRRDERISVGLKAALLDDQAMPRGCRVRDFSPRGMLLQYDYDGNTASFDDGDPIAVRLSLRQADEREIVTLPSTVRRVDQNGIGVEFIRAEPRLLELLEPYRLDSQRTQPAALESNGVQTVHAGSGGSVARLAASRYRSRGAGGAATADAPGVSGTAQTAAEGAGRGMRTVEEHSRKLFYVGLFSLIVAAAILVFDFADSAAVKDRLSTLEATASDQASLLGEMRGEFSVADSRGSELDALNIRMEALAGSVSALEGRLSPRVAQHQTDAGGAPQAPTADGPNGAEREQRADLAAAETLEAPARQALAAAAQREPQPHSDLPWLINLVSSHDKVAADHFVARARSKDIPVEQNRVRVRGKDVWRLQVTGFASESEARAYGALARDKLGLDDIWVFRR